MKCTYGLVVLLAPVLAFAQAAATSPEHAEPVNAVHLPDTKAARLFGE